LDIAIDILHMRLHSYKDMGYSASDEIISIGQYLLFKMTFGREDKYRDRMDYELSEIVKVCFVEKTASVTARKLCNKMAKALSKYLIYPHDYKGVLASLAKNQPIGFLDGFFGDVEDPDFQLPREFGDSSDHEPNPLSQIEDCIIVEWCERNPSIRYPIMAASIDAYRHSSKENSLEWTPLSLIMIDNAPDIITVLNKFKLQFRPMSWSGSRADIMQHRLSLLVHLKTHQNQLVAEWAGNEEITFSEEINSERNLEQGWSRSRDESFE
jgi:hypothetical protein